MADAVPDSTRRPAAEIPSKFRAATSSGHSSLGQVSGARQRSVGATGHSMSHHQGPLAEVGPVQLSAVRGHRCPDLLEALVGGDAAGPRSSFWVEVLDRCDQ